MDRAATPAALNKSSLRLEMLVRRDALEIDVRLEWDQAIAGHVLALDFWKGAQAQPVSGYWPMRSEADPRPVLEELAVRKFKLCLPALTPSGMIFRKWQPYEPLVPGGFGTLVPPINQSQITPAILIVPLAAFDRRGYRIGYGKGHYDRVLKALSPVISIGITYAAQEISEVPEEAHDQPLDMIVTENEVIRAMC
jgi:5-formyltetrahydrofolate cyclo-ligase